LDEALNIKIVNGLKSVNTFTPVNIETAEGNVQPFLDHLNLLLPNPADQEILLSYMAAVVQYQGVKFRWCVLLQGVEGNGKTLFCDVLRYAVSDRYTHIAQGADIDNKFNFWLKGSILVIVNDIVVARNRKEDVMNTLRPMLTDGRIGVQKKGKDQSSADIVCNFFMTANPKDAVIKSATDRRYCIFFTNQQTKRDVARDRMTGAYFPNLYNWLKKEGGFQFVTNYLKNYKISDHLNPATFCAEAPITSSTREAIRESLGGIEQEILEFVQQDAPGFKDGWINGNCVNNLLKEMRFGQRVPHNKRKELLERIGYVWHPALKDGRASVGVYPDNQRSKLFIHEESPYIKLTDPKAVIDQYHISQGHDPAASGAEIFTMQQMKGPNDVQNNS
jgi:hypothetical protein